jgi:hypothetical protein
MGFFDLPNVFGGIFNKKTVFVVFQELRGGGRR